MSLNETPRAERLTIGFFGSRNAGKSSLLNAITNQEMAVVSEYAGTTTDPVIKSMELLPLGPVTLIDTPGYDDIGALGEKRVLKTKQILEKTDIALLVIDAKKGISDTEKELEAIFKEKNIPYIIVYNKSDLVENKVPKSDNEIFVSSLTNDCIHELKEKIAGLKPEEKSVRLVADFIEKGDTVILVCPIDQSAPKGRIILPQQQAIRDILDGGSIASVVQPEQLKETLDNLKTPPKMVICDSQVFKKVSLIVPDSIPLTSFSILFARYKGLLDIALDGAKKLDSLCDGDKILISEGCTHHRQCGDIGTEKIPAWLRAYTGKNLNFEFTQGGAFPEELKGYALVIHCGGCMLTDKEIRTRQEKAKAQNVPFTNFGMTIAKVNGILERSTAIL